MEHGPSRLLQRFDGCVDRQLQRCHDDVVVLQRVRVECYKLHVVKREAIQGQQRRVATVTDKNKKPKP
jgi:hypothetical protein